MKLIYNKVHHFRNILTFELTFDVDSEILSAFRLQVLAILYSYFFVDIR